MSAVPCQTVRVSRRTCSSQGTEHGDETKFHRLRTVRRQEGVSLRTVARRMGRDMRSVREEEDESHDLRISEIYEWQRALDVPLVDLLVDPGTPLSRPVFERAQLLRLMKTAAAIASQSGNEEIQRLARTMVNQLIDIMPELQGVTPWHRFGKRRSHNDYGRTAERCVSEDLILKYAHD